MVAFNSNRTKTIYNNVSCENVKEISWNGYQPNSGTPFYDTMGIELTKCRYEIEEKQNHQVLVKVFSDGYENDSEQFTGKMVQKLIEELKEKKWRFDFIGANQYDDQLTKSLSIDNCMSRFNNSLALRDEICSVKDSFSPPY